MPTRWVGGVGSKACPLKDQIIEARILNDHGADGGTVLLVVKRFYTPGEQGRFLLGDFISAGSRAFRLWAESKDSGFSQVDGSYHLCKGDPGECPAVSRHGVTIHLGKWRTWKEEELIAGGVPEYDRPGNGLITRFFKGGEKGVVKLPHRGFHGPGLVEDLKLVMEEPDLEELRSKRDPALPEAEDEEKETVSRLRKELAELKAALSKAEAEKGKKDKKKRRGASARGKASSDESRKKKEKKKKGPFNEGGLRRGAGGDDPGDDAPDWGGSDESSDEDDSDDGSDETKKSEKPRGTGRKDRKRKGGDPPGDDPDEDKDDPSGGSEKRRKAKKKKKRKKKEKDKKKRKSGTRKEKKLEKDKGPFGVGESRRVPKDSTSSGSLSEDSSDSSQSFRKAPSGLTLHLRLQRYAMKHPGRLASRLLQRMAKATRFEGATSLTKRKELETPACALTYFLTILTPTLKEKWTPRTQREMRILVEILDKMASAQGATAADIVAQRIKALEQSAQDGNQWKRAKFLEIVDPEEVTLTDRGEANMIQKEVELEDRLKGRPTWNPPNWEKGHKGKGGKGDGDPKGKGKGGKNKTPAQEAAEKKEK